MFDSAFYNTPRSIEIYLASGVTGWASGLTERCGAEGEEEKQPRNQNKNKRWEEEKIKQQKYWLDWLHYWNSSAISSGARLHCWFLNDCNENFNRFSSFPSFMQTSSQSTAVLLIAICMCARRKRECDEKKETIRRRISKSSWKHRKDERFMGFDLLAIREMRLKDESWCCARIYWAQCHKQIDK